MAKRMNKTKADGWVAVFISSYQIDSGGVVAATADFSFWNAFRQIYFGDFTNIILLSFWFMCNTTR